MPQKRTRVKKAGIMVVPKEPLSPKERQWLEDLKKGSGEMGKPVKPKPYRPKTKPKPKPKPKKKKKKESPVKTLLYKGRPVGKRKRSVSV